jgi:hypothetical protein
MEGSAAGIVVLDACRDNPLAAQMAMSGTRSVGRGLARVETADVGLLSRSIPELAGDAGVSPSYFTRILRLSFLAP